MAARQAVQEVRDGLIERFAYRVGGCAVVVETVRDDTTPAWDLHALADERSPAGALARRLIGLREEPPRAEDAAWAERRVAELCRGRWTLGEHAPAPDARALAIDACGAALDQLLASRPGGA